MTATDPKRTLDAVADGSQSLPLSRELSDSIALLIPMSKRACMRREKIKDWLEIVGMGAIVASLLFVGLQIRQDQRVAVMEAVGNDASLNAQLADTLQGNGELWQRGLDGEELSKAERIEFSAMASAVRYIFTINWNRANLLDETQSPDSAVRDYSIALHTHVGLRRYFDARIERISQTDMVFDVPVELSPFDKSAISRLDYLTANSIPVPENKSYIFW